MTINYLANFTSGDRTANSFDVNPIFNNKYLKVTAKVYALKNTVFSKDLSLIDKNYISISKENCDLIILSEPENDLLNENEINNFKEQYNLCIHYAKLRQTPIVHIVTNPKWHVIFDEIIHENNIKVFIPQSLQEILNLPEERIVLVREYMSINSFISYTNNINSNILLDLTMAYETDYHYKLNLLELLHKVKDFSSVEIIINDNSFLPDFIDENIKIYKESQFDWDRINNLSYIYYHSNNPYNLKDVDKLLFYAANSNIIYSNYNFYINNLLPSVIMNLSKEDYNIVLLPEKEAMDIMNENRNTVLFNNTSINIVNDLCSLFINKHYIESYELSNTMDNFTDNLYLRRDSSTHVIDLNIKTFKYDLEKTLTLPIIFLGKGKVKYASSTAIYDSEKQYLEIPLYTDKKQINNDLDKELSMIVPIHNNGRYLKYKCFNSILRLSCLEKLEIIFIDDGSSDEETLRIIDDLRADYTGIIYKRFESGSGSASRPRNVGMQISSCKYITFLDPDNEAIEDGYTKLLDELKANDELDMVVADIVREDNIKRNDISYYKKVMNVRNSPYISNMRKLLLDTNLSVQSIQALIVKKEIIDKNNLIMIEGAAGQDTLFFQELLLKCNYIKVMNKNVHSYYAYVEGSVTNTVSYKFFEKFYKVEIERKKFLEKENLIDFYMDIRFNSYMKNWYYMKLKQVNSQKDEELAKEIIFKIFELYSDFDYYYDDYTKSIKKLLAE